jgi:hypothetical protein
MGLLVGPPIEACLLVERVRADLLAAKEALENPAQLRNDEVVISGQNWVDGRQAARLLGLRTHHGQEADQAGEIPV